MRKKLTAAIVAMSVGGIPLEPWPTVGIGRRSPRRSWGRIAPARE